MALDRKFLAALGIDNAQADQIIEQHVTTVNELKDERDKLKADAERLPKVEKQLAEAIKAVKEIPEVNEYEQKYNDLKKEFDTYKAEQAAAEAKANKQAAYRKLLHDAGVSEKRIDLVMRVSDFDSIELDENNNAKDAEKLIESIKNEWAEFISTDSTVGAKVPKPPANNQGNGFENMTVAEKMAYANEHPDEMKAVLDSINVKKG